VTQNFSLSSDQFAVMVKTPKDGCMTYETLETRRPPGLGAAAGAGRAVDDRAAGRGAPITAGTFEGNPKWLTHRRNQEVT
jgi:hypothetical protein